MTSFPSRDGAPENPFPGLRPFRTDEDYLFFGREEQTTELLTLLREHRFLAVVGTSGSGKSSLVRAGLIPALHRGTMTRAGSSWEIVLLRPGGDPIGNLARGFCDADLYDRDDPETLPRLLATLRHSGRGLVGAYRESGPEKDVNLLVVVDQFEEIFRFRQNDAESQDEASAFVELLLEASRQTECPVYVVLTMRSDYLGDCSGFRGLAESVNEGEFLIPRLKREQLRKAIEGPVKVGGGEIANRLAQNLLNNVGDDPDQLPVLQHALMRTWDCWEGDHSGGEPIDLRHYEATGGMQEALSRHADEVYDSLPDVHHREVAVRVFRALTEKGADNRGVRRPTRLAQLERIVGARREVVTNVIEYYRKPGVTFLMPGVNRSLADRTVIDLSHESLMRIWSRLRTWVEDEAQSVRIYRRLVETACLWKEGQAGLYHDPDLQIARSWVEAENPNASWADQNGGGFEEAMAFLTRSREAAEEAERVREAARQRELEQARRLAETQSRAARTFKRFSAAMVVVALLALMAMAYALVAHREADRARDDVARSLSRSDLIRGTELVWRLESARGLPYLLRSHSLDESNGATVEATFNVLARRSVPAPAVEIALDGEPLVTASRGNWLAVGFIGATRVFDLSTGDLLVELTEESGRAVLALAFSDDGAVLVTGGADGFASFWEWKEGKRIHRVDFYGAPGFGGFRIVGTEPTLVAEAIYPGSRWFSVSGLRDRRPRYSRIAEAESDRFATMVLHPAGQGVVVQSASSVIGFLDAERRTGLVTLQDDEDGRTVTAFDLSPDGAWLAAALERVVTLKRLDPDEEPTVLGSLQGDVVDVRFSPEGRRLVTASRDGTAKIWNLRDREELTVLQHPVPVREAWFSPDGLMVLTMSVDSRARLWNAETGELFQEPFPHLGPHGRSPFVGDGSRVLVRPGGQRLWLVDTRKVPRMPLVLKHPGAVHGASLGVNGELVVSACEDGSARIWSVADGTIQWRLEQGSPVLSASFDPAGKRVLTTARDGTARVWEVEGGGELRRITPAARIISARFSADGASILGSLEFGIVRVWSSATGEARGPALRHAAPVLSAAISLDGARVVTGTGDDAVTVWDVETGRELLRIDDLATSVVAVGLEPSGERLAFVTADGELHVASSRTGDALLEIDHEVVDVSWAPDGGRLLTIGADGSVRLWGSRTGELTAEPMVHAERVTAAVLDGEGSRVLTTSGRTARVWDAASGQPLSPPLDHGGTTTAGEFGPEALQVLTASLDGTVRLWDTGFPRDVKITRKLMTLAEAVHRQQPGGVEKSRKDGGASVKELEAEARPGAGADAFDRVAAWYLSETGETRLSPYSALPLSSRLSRSLEDGDLNGLRWDVLLHPEDPLRRARLAVGRLAQSRTRGDRFLSELDLEWAIEAAPEDPGVWFLRGAALALMGNETEATRSHERMWELGEPDLGTLLERIELQRRLGVAPEARKVFLDRALDLATAGGAVDERTLVDLRARRLEILSRAGKFRDATADWEFLRSGSRLGPARTEELLVGHLDAARTEFDASTESERRAGRRSYLAAALLRWFLPIYRGDLSRKFRHKEMLRGFPDIDVPRVPLVPRNSVWKYLDDGTDPGPEWRDLSFDDGAWKSGRGPLGFGDPRQTIIRRTDDRGDLVVTHYFRRRFEVERIPDRPDFLIEILRDDGAIVYLNGAEIHRENMPGGEVAPSTFSTDIVGGDNEQRYILRSKRFRRQLREGVNLVAVEVHQCNLGSSDLGFDLQLDLGVDVRRYLEDLPDDDWEDVVAAMESLVPENGGLRDAVRLAFSRDPEQESLSSVTAGAWLARAHVLGALYRRQRGLEAIDRAIALAREEPSRTLSRARVVRDYLDVRARLLRSLDRGEEAREVEEEMAAVPPRSPALGPLLIDLGPYYNASRYIGREWHSEDSSSRLDDLPEVVTSFRGIHYDVRGVIQLNSGVYPESAGGAIANRDLNGLMGTDYPDSVTIPIGRKAESFHFLNSTIYGREDIIDREDEDREAVVARYVFHYADGSRVEEPLVFGRDVSDWRLSAGLSDLRSLAWSGNGTILQEKMWRNPFPDRVVSHIDFISAGGSAAPFLLAITIAEK